MHVRAPPFTPTQEAPLAMDDGLAKLRRERWETALLFMFGVLIVVAGAVAGVLVGLRLF
jgi:hypothetical protein